MATQNSNNNDVNVVSLFPVSITTADDISLASSNEILIAGTNGTAIQDDTSIALESPANYGVLIDNGTQSAQVMVGTGDPDGSLTALQGSMYLNVAGTGNDTIFVNTDGAMSWYNPGSNFTWQITAAAGPTALVSNNGYFANNAGTISFTLPTSGSAIGDKFAVAALNNATSWIINQTGSQFIVFGNVSTSVGAGGSIAANTVGDTIEFVCLVADAAFWVTSAVGNPTIV